MCAWSRGSIIRGACVCLSLLNVSLPLSYEQVLTLAQGAATFGRVRLLQGEAGCVSSQASLVREAAAGILGRASPVGACCRGSNGW